MTELMTPEALDLNSRSAQWLYKVLRHNSLVGYNLQAPAYFFHSLDDDVVPLINSTNLMAQMSDEKYISYDIGHYGSHMEASIPFMKHVYQDL